VHDTNVPHLPAPVITDDEGDDEDNKDIISLSSQGLEAKREIISIRDGGATGAVIGNDETGEPLDYAGEADGKDSGSELDADENLDVEEQSGHAVENKNRRYPRRVRDPHKQRS